MNRPREARLQKEGTEMSTEANKALVRRWAEEVMSKGDLNMIDELFAIDYIDHTNPPDWPPRREGHKQIIDRHASVSRSRRQDRRALVQ